MPLSQVMTTFPVNWRTDDDLALAEACTRIKGTCCYGPGAVRPDVNSITPPCSIALPYAGSQSTCMLSRVSHSAEIVAASHPGGDRERGPAMRIGYQISVGTMCVLTLGCGVALAAVAVASPLWVSLVRDLTVLTLATAVAGAIFGPPPRRVFWGGLAITGWLFLPPIVTLLSLGESVAGHLSTEISQRIHPYVEGVTLPADPENGSSTFDRARGIWGRDLGKRAANTERILRDLSALIYGVSGGLLAQVIAVHRRARSGPASDTPPTDG